jgi:hypothetical protein
VAEGGPDRAIDPGSAPFELSVAAHGPTTLEFTARHGTGWIPSGGGTVIEVGMPALRRSPPGQHVAPFDVSATGWVANVDDVATGVDDVPPRHEAAGLRPRRESWLATHEGRLHGAVWTKHLRSGSPLGDSVWTVT